MPSRTASEPSRPLDRVSSQDAQPMPKLVRQRLREGQVALFIGREAIATQAILGQTSQFLSQSFRCLTRLSRRHNSVRQAYRERLLSIHWASCQYQVQCPAQTNQARQPHSTAVNQRDAPAAAETPTTASSSITRRSHQSASSSPPATA